MNVLFTALALALCAPNLTTADPPALCPPGCPCRCAETGLCVCAASGGDRAKAVRLRTQLTRDSYRGTVWPAQGIVVLTPDGWDAVPFAPVFASASRWLGWA